MVASTGITYSIEAVSLKSPQADGQRPTSTPTARSISTAKSTKLCLTSSTSTRSSRSPESALALINFTGTDSDENRVLFSVWNDFEYPLSYTIEFKCWFEERLSRISSLFTEGFLAGTPNDPGELDLTCNGQNDFETGWAIIESMGVRNPGGTLIDPDGALLGALTTGVSSNINGGRLLAESTAKQTNGSFDH